MLKLVAMSLIVFSFAKEKPMENKEIAIVAGGCFWGVEEIFRKIPGVTDSIVGYTGGKIENPSYELVKTGATGHAEAVQITFDPKKITYEQVLGYFFRLHDPTQVDRQQNDKGTQYRSAIFYLDDNQKAIAENVKEKVDKSKKWKDKVVTQKSNWL
jgi:methionine-S-sulfoxide reductase